MKILITGATGLVGSELISLCLKRKTEVNFLTTRREKLEAHMGAQGFLWNPENEEIDTECFTGVSSIINLAGEPIATRWTKANKDKILNSRLKSLQTLYKGLEQSGQGTVQSLISASAIGIYPHSHTTYYTEKETQNVEGFAGEVVAAWEKEAYEFKQLVPKVAVVRIGLVLSDMGGALPQMAKPVKLGVGAAFGSGEQWQSWIHISDLSSLLLFLVDQQLEGKFNAVAPNPITQKKLLKELAQVLNKPLFLPNIPGFMLKILLGEMSEILISSQRVSSKKIESLGFGFQYQNICRALQSLYLKKAD